MCKQNIGIGFPAKGLFNFITVPFKDDIYFSVVNLVVHSVLLDYKYRPNMLIYSEDDPAVRIVNDDPNSELQDLPAYIPKDFTECLLNIQKENDNNPISSSQAIEVYNNYMQQLQFNLEKIKAKIIEIGENFSKESNILTLFVTLFWKL